MVTQKQIARELGVSRQLVGYALRGEGHVSERERVRVLEAAARLGYSAHSNHEARALIARRYSRSVRSGVIGCVYLPSASAGTFPEEGHLSYETRLLHGIRQEAQRAGQEIMLLNNRPSAGWEKVDGLLVHGGAPVREQLGVAIPVVSMMRQVADRDSVMADDEDGARQATEHLIGLGHRRIAYLLDVSRGNAPSQQRLRGYHAALWAAGIAPLKTWLGELQNYGPMLERGRISMAHWLQHGWQELGCTALMVQNDRAAIGAMAVLRASGIRVPQDVSVIGFDSTDECEIASPRLTSVRVPLEEIGAAAHRLLLRRLDETGERIAETENPVSPSAAGFDNVVLPTQLQVRDSTAPPGSRD